MFTRQILAPLPNGAVVDGDLQERVEAQPISLIACAQVDLAKRVALLDLWEVVRDPYHRPERDSTRTLWGANLVSPSAQGYVQIETDVREIVMVRLGISEWFAPYFIQPELN
jgi:hypothetical protein